MEWRWISSKSAWSSAFLLGYASSSPTATNSQAGGIDEATKLAKF